MEFINYIPASLAQAISWTLIHSLWQVSLIGLVLFIHLNFIKEDKHNTKYGTALVALFSSFTVVIGTFLYYYFQLTTVLVPGTEITLIDGQGSSQEVINFVGLSGMENIFYQLEYYGTFIASFWMFGAFILMIRFVMGLYQTRAIKLSAIPIVEEKLLDILEELKVDLVVQKTVSIAESVKVKTALLVGFWTPVILFPVGMINQLSTDELKAILAHELAHIKRNDFIINILQTFAEVILYYHPVVWWMRNIINEEREICCDNMAIELTQNKHAYAKALVKLQEIENKNGIDIALGFSKKPSQFKIRLLNILQQPIPKNLNKERSIALLAFVIFAFAFTNFETEKKEALVEEIPMEETIKETSIRTNEVLEEIIDNQSESVEELSIIEEDITEADTEILEQIVSENNKNLNVKPSNDIIAIEIPSKAFQLSNGATYPRNIIKKFLRDTLPSEEYESRMKAYEKSMKEYAKAEELRIKEYEKYIQRYEKEIQNYEAEIRTYEKQLQDEEHEIERMVEKMKKDMEEYKKNHVMDEEGIQKMKEVSNAYLESIYSKAAKNRYSFKYNFSTGEKIYPNGGPPPPPAPPAPPPPPNIGHPVPPMPPVPPVPPIDIKPEFEKQLLKDGLIESPKKYKLELTYKHFIVNGKKQSSALHQKYLKLYEDVTGETMYRGSHIKISKSKNNSSTSISIEDEN